MEPQCVKTTQANGEVRYWLLIGAVRVVDFEQQVKKLRGDTVKKVEFIRVEDVPCTIAELIPVKDR